MIECPICKNENFNKWDYCEKCGKPISHIKPEPFHFAEFIRKNSQIYSVIGILIAVSAFLINLTDSNTDFIVFFVVLIVTYLVLFLIQKGYKIVKTSHLDEKETNIRLLNITHFSFYLFAHILLIYAMFYYIPKDLRIWIAAALGFFIVFVYTLQTLTTGKKLNPVLVFLFAAFLVEIAIIQLFSIPFFASITNNGTFAFYYIWSIPVIINFIIGGIIAYLLLTQLSQYIIPDYTQAEHITWDFWDKFAEKNPKWNMFLGFIVLLALILIPIVWQVLTTHRI